jgi:uncharacterized membrane protein YgdD (TMEM256/DUF423 family)
MAKIFIMASGLMGAVGVSAGAIGAHVLRHRLSTEMLAMYDKAVLYLLLHALALFATGILVKFYPSSSLLRAAGSLYLVGIILFCGSLFLISVTGLRPFPFVAPAGGMALILAWLVVLAGAFVEM